MKRTVIIAASGSGERMESNTPKQFIMLDEKPIIVHTINAFYSYDSKIEIVVALREGYKHYWNDIFAAYQLDSSIKVTRGGAERFHSIRNALKKCTGDLIAVHDAVRPLVSTEVISKCFDTAEIAGAAIPVLPIKSSLRKISFDESEAVDRSIYREVQTPQVFKANIIKMAYKQKYQTSFTDDATVVEIVSASDGLEVTKTASVLDNNNNGNNRLDNNNRVNSNNVNVNVSIL